MQEYLETILCSFERNEKINFDNIYFDYSEEEKIKFDSYKKVSKLDGANNDFAVLIYDTNDDKYLIVSERENEIVDNKHFERIENSFAELAALSEQNCLSISTSYSINDIYDRIFIYEDENYSGHKVQDIMDIFVPFSVYKVDRDFVLQDQNEYCLYLYFLLCSKKVKGCHFSKKTEDVIEETLLSGLCIPYYNLFLAVSSNQWRHAFLETYRIIEHAYPAISLKKIKENGIDIPVGKIAYILEDVISYRPPEENTLKEIFEEISEVKALQNILLEFDSVKNPEENRYKWYYKKVRNQIVHFRIKHEDVSLSEEQWDILIRFNISLILYLYKTYGEELEIN